NRSVVLGDGDPLHGVSDRRRWSTRDLMRIEHDIVDKIAAGRDAGIAQVTARAVRVAVSNHPTISDEQAEMVDSITRAGHRIDAVLGVAGSGKTFALGVANDVWTPAGFTTIGLAHAGKAARGLEHGSGIPSSTIDMFLTQAERPGSPGLPKRSVVVIDEAGMVPTRKLSALLKHMRTDTKVVLVGDHHQLPEIGAGGVLRGIVERLDDVPVLTENRRQRDPCERMALAEIRDGDVGAGLDWYVEAGRVTPCENIDDACARLVDSWWDDRRTDRVDQLMMAERRTDVGRLNYLARARFAAAGGLSKERLQVSGHDYAIGDRVMFAKNDYGLGVRNGERALVVSLDQKDRTVTVAVDDHDDPVTIPSEYLENGSLEWGFAATVHKNQGATSDYSYLLASDRLYRELGYTALSRGRVENRIWTVADIEPDFEVEESHGADPEADRSPIDALLRAMERSAAQQLAIDEAADLEAPGIEIPVVADVAELIDRRDAIDRHLFRSAPLRVSDELAEASRRLETAERRLADADDHEWAARNEGVAEGRAQLDQYAAMQARFDDWTSDHQGDLVDRRVLDAQIQRTLTERVVAIEHEPPADLVAAIGHPPVGVDVRSEWRAAAVDLFIEDHRNERAVDTAPVRPHEAMELT
ncbi:MAG: AAA family ATPase, partial [Ilumatobacter sp.]|uniref:ATP-dependent DNA helicase n=1 Tax=Ilumatobacter sp. TaxID=1967498 RepID=UPI003C767780